ncbi:MAG: tetratricopeptide repeat protein [Nitrospinota bacterium]|nr:tetratricopeptide repeat protein [Nitrospinota bacterium]
MGPIASIVKVNNVLALTLLVFVSFLGYGSTFNFPFQFDDEPTIILNPAIRDVGDLSRIASFYPPRFFGVLSFALNYYFGELNPFGYHLVNFILYILTSFVVFKFTRLLLEAAAVRSEGPSVQERWLPDQENRSVCALGVALVFAVHPLQTQAVTYITQRFALLSAFFYLLSMFFYLKGLVGEKKKPLASYYVPGAFVAALLAMFCKQNAFTLPIAILLLEFFFGTLSPRHPHTRGYRWVPFLLLLAVIPVTIWLGGDFDKNKILALNENRPSRGDYFLTQFSVILTYLRLLLFPVNQNLDYDYPVASSLFSWQGSGSIFLVLGILILTVRLVKTCRLLSFGVLFFFLTLAVESSFIPLDNFIYEHRIYLPSVGFFIAGLSYFFCQTLQSISLRLKELLLILVVAVLLANTYDRNQVWRDEVTLWTDVVAKSPQKDRAHGNLGIALALRGISGPAVREFNQALSLNPDNLKARFNLGVTYFKMGLVEKALDHYRLVLALEPNHAEAYYNMGVAYAQLGQKQKAARYYRKVLAVDPRHAKAHNNLAVFYHFHGEYAKAIEHADWALRGGYPVHQQFLQLLQMHRK